MIHVATLTLLLLFSVLSPGVTGSFFDDENGNGNGNGHDGGDGHGGTGSIPSIPMIPIKSGAKNVVQINEFKINVENIKVDIDSRKCSSCDGLGLGLSNNPAIRQCVLACIARAGNDNIETVQGCINECIREVGDGEGETTPSYPKLDDTTPIFPDSSVPNEPAITEVILGELDSNITTQGLPGLPVSKGPIITSFTYKIENDKKGHTPVVTFIIRGRGFDISSLFDKKLLKDLDSLIEPRVYLGSICLKVVKFSDTCIEARFEDIEDQKTFKPGTYRLVVKVLDVEKKIGILSNDNDVSTLSKLGGLTLPELKIIGPSFPVLPKPILPNPLKLLFNGLKFVSVELLVTISSTDAEKIRAACKVIM